MKLLLRRDQRSGIMGRVVFSLTVRAELSETEKSHIKKYRLGDTLLYTRAVMTDPGRGLLGAASRLAFKMTNLTLTVDDLSQGKVIECKDVVEMLAVEQQIREAAETFKNVLTAAASFGGDIVVTIDDVA